MTELKKKKKKKKSTVGRCGTEGTRLGKKLAPLCQEKGTSFSWEEDLHPTEVHGLAGGGRAELWPHLLPGLGTLAQCANCTALRGNPIWCQHCVWFRISTQLKSLKGRWMKGKISWAATTTHYCQLLLPSRQESMRAWSMSWPCGWREWTVSFLVLPG